MQRVPPATGTGLDPKVASTRNEIELLGTRLKIHQINIATFLRTTNEDINNIRNYFKWLNDVYARCYGHYALVINQADAEAQTEQAWLDIASGVTIGVAVGLIGEAAIAGLAAKAALESVAEVAGELVEGGIGSRVKFEVLRPIVATELAPALKEVQSLKKLDQLNAAILPATVASSVYLDPIVQAERLTTELRVAEAGGARRMTDSAPWGGGL